MARRAKGNKINGWIALDKPVGMTSTHAVARIKRLFQAEKVGHAGTLDPLASGLLPIALGEATKTVPFVMDGKKVYRFMVRWGEETNTDDSEGEAVKVSAARPSESEILSILSGFTGEIEQVPPAFSALKIDGARAYDLARAGEEITLKPRCVSIDRLTLLDIPNSDTALFETLCGKGTYVRALARDMGRKLGVYGHVVALRRLKVGPFGENDMISLEVVEELAHKGAGESSLAKVLLPVATALDDIPALALTEKEARRLIAGQPIFLRGRDAPLVEGPACAKVDGRLIALCHVEGGEIHPKRIFHLNAA